MGSNNVAGHTTKSKQGPSSVSKMGKEKFITGGIKPSVISWLVGSSRAYTVGEGSDLMGYHWTLTKGEQYCRVVLHNH